MTGSDFEFPRMALAPGLRVGAYEVQEQIGHGGMGDVYRARDTNLNREVALKVISMRFMDDPDRISRFRREARILAALNHPNIGGIYGVEEIAGQTVLVLELVDGISLANRIARGALPVADAVVVAKQIAEALEAAHESGIVHRDLKPDNVKLRTDGTLKVLDFGIATTLKPAADIQSAVTTVTVDSPRITSTGAVLGTAAYMSPEQARGENVDQRSDIWAFGVIVYEMLTGRHPFVGRSLADTFANVLNREPSFDLLPTPDPAVRRLLQRCLQKDPRHRLHHIADARLEIEDSLKAGDSRQAAPSAASERSMSLVQATIGSLFRVSRLSIVVMIVPLMFCAVGFVNSEIFNRALDLPATEAFVDYFVFGYRAMFGPAAFLSVSAIGTIIGLTILALLARVGTVIWPRHPLRHLSKKLSGSLLKLAGTHERTLAQVFSFAATAAVVIYVGVAWRLLAVIVQMVVNGPAAGVDISVLTPAQRPYVLFVVEFGSVLLLGLGAAWVALFSWLVRRHADPLTIHVFRLRSLVAIISILVIIVAPWRLVWDNRREPVSFDGRSAFVMREDSSRVLLYMPGSSSFEVSPADPRLVRSDPSARRSVFSN